ncbi:MAG: DUF6800 family protein [Planctomycetota bacterium]
MPRTERDREKERRRKHKVKLKKLEGRFRKATSQSDKQLIAAKVRRFSPMINLEVRAAEAAAQAKADAAEKKAKK